MTNPASGDVWRYDYLWRWQHESGETEGRKRRPVAFVAVLPDAAGKTHLFILPITSKQPGLDRLSIPVPPIERRRARLDDMPLWILIDEYNYDQLEASFYLDPNGRLGAFSRAFHETVLRTFTRAARERRVGRVSRTD